MNLALKNKVKTMTTAEKLRRISRDLDHETISNLAGLPDATLAAIIAGNYTPSAIELFKVSRVLDVSLDWLMDESRTFGPRWKYDDSRSAAQHIAALLHLINIIRRPVRAGQKAICKRLKLNANDMLGALRSLSWADRADVLTLVGNEHLNAVDALLNLPDIERAIVEFMDEIGVNEAA